MILISCRRDFADSRFFAPDNVIRDYVALPDAFTELDEGELAERMHGHHVLILVHGFRNSLRNVYSAYQRTLKGLTDSGLTGDAGYGLVIGFTWPGFETLLGFFPAVPFANRASGYFRRLVELASRHARTVDVQAHSLGARVVLQTLAGQTEGFVDNVLLLSGAVDDEVLEPRREFHGALELCRRCVVYHTERDKTLKIAYRIGDLPEFDRAIGWKGPQHPEIIRDECHDVFVVDCKKLVASHGGYRDVPAYYRHWARVVREEPLEQFEVLR